MVEALSQLRDRLADGDRISAGTFTDISSAIRLMQSFGDVSEARLNQQLASLQQAVNGMITAGESRSHRETFMDAIAGHRGTFSQIAERVITQCQDGTAIAAARAKYGSPMRAIVLDDPE
jgi:hypothetical protein